MKPMAASAAASHAELGISTRALPGHDSHQRERQRAEDQDGIGNGFAHDEGHRPIGEFHRDFQDAGSGQGVAAGVRAPGGEGSGQAPDPGQVGDGDGAVDGERGSPAPAIEQHQVGGGDEGDAGYVMGIEGAEERQGEQHCIAPGGFPGDAGQHGDGDDGEERLQGVGAAHARVEQEAGRKGPQGQ